MLHPLEVGSLLSVAGYPDQVVAAGVLHDVLEDTDTDAAELQEAFGAKVADLVRTVSEDEAIDDRSARKATLRAQVRSGSHDAAAVFAADKVSKARELRLRLSCGLHERDSEPMLDHYRESLLVLEDRLGVGHPLVEQVRFELETLDALPPSPDPG